jgi:hypothetical protein
MMSLVVLFAARDNVYTLRECARAALVFSFGLALMRFQGDAFSPSGRPST